MTKPFFAESASSFRMFGGLSRAAYFWAKSGFSLADEKTYSERLSVCNSCENWITSGKIPKCKICGCYVGKLRLATSKCPINKW